MPQEREPAAERAAASDRRGPGCSQAARQVRSPHPFWWQAQDRKILKRINGLITEIQRNGNEGIGKPEPLKHGFQGYWSRRITDEHRIVYKIVEDEIRIAACRYHYER